MQILERRARRTAVNLVDVGRRDAKHEIGVVDDRKGKVPTNVAPAVVDAISVWRRSRLASPGSRADD